MINWHSLKGLTQVRKQWLIDAAVAHNIKLKLNIQNQVTAITAITRLDLSNNGLTQVPLCIFQMHSLKILNLSQNKLETLPETDSELLSPMNATKSGLSKMRKSRSYSSALTSNNSSNQSNGKQYLFEFQKNE
jgi:Leucine-rich repeat (LRR) protein